MRVARCRLYLTAKSGDSWIKGRRERGEEKSAREREEGGRCFRTFHGSLQNVGDVNCARERDPAIVRSVGTVIFIIRRNPRPPLVSAVLFLLAAFRERIKEKESARDEEEERKRMKERKAGRKRERQTLWRGWEQGVVSSLSAPVSAAVYSADALLYSSV